MALLSNQVNKSISQSSSQKTATRFAAENSLCGSVSNLALIGSTHFIPVSSDNSDPKEEIKSVSEVTKMLLNFLSNVCGTSMFPLLPELIILTNDTSEYVFEPAKTCSYYNIINNETINQCIASSGRLQINVWYANQTHFLIHCYWQFLSISHYRDWANRP